MRECANVPSSPVQWYAFKVEGKYYTRLGKVTARLWYEARHLARLMWPEKEIEIIREDLFAP